MDVSDGRLRQNQNKKQIYHLVQVQDQQVGDLIDFIIRLPFEMPSATV